MKVYPLVWVPNLYDKFVQNVAHQNLASNFIEPSKKLIFKFLMTRLKNLLSEENLLHLIGGFKGNSILIRLSL